MMSGGGQCVCQDNGVQLTSPDHCSTAPLPPLISLLHILKWAVVGSELSRRYEKREDDNKIFYSVVPTPPASSITTC